MGVTRIDTAAGAARLADKLNAPHRQRPVVLVSTSAATNQAWIDVEEIDSELGGLADVYLIETGEATWALSRRIPPKTEAYGGAGRVYPTDDSWVSDLRRSPLHFAFDPRTGQRSTRALISDAWDFANRAGLLAGSVSPATRMAAGVVEGIPTPDRAMVKLDDRNWATITQELTVPGVPLADIVREGQRVHGSYDPASGRLDISASVRSVADALAAYRSGATVLARVEEVRSRSARLALYPGAEAWVRGEDVTSNELDDFRTLMTEGEVVVAHLLSREPDWKLVLADVDDDERPVEAPAIIAGGRNWLVPPTFESPIAVLIPPPTDNAAPTELEAPPEPLPTPPTSGKAVQDLGLKVAALEVQLSQVTSQLAELQRERDMLASQLTRAHSEADQLRRQARQLRTEVRRRSRRSTSEELDGLFADPEEQLRFQIQHRWAIRIPAGDKERRPLGDYAIGPGFIDSMDRLEGISRAKMLDVVVEVLTGLAKDLPGRQLHPLRTSEAGDAPQATRSTDGAHAWRVNLQTGTPSARRLHYWQRTDGSVELARVAVHDDFTI